MLSRQASEVSHSPQLEADSAPLEHIAVPEQIQEAFAALKQQGVRLYLAILDNHSGKQLAAETEKLNGLIEEVESTVTQTEGLVKELHDVIDARMRKTQSTVANSGSLQIFEQDANRVMQAADEWKKELEQLGESFSELKNWIDQRG
jgi:Cu/Ag efflux pump CusA